MVGEDVRIPDKVAPASAANDFVHLVGTAEIFHESGTYQVAAEGYLGGRQAGVQQYELQQGAVEHDIPMVGDEQVSFAACDMFFAAEGESSRTLPYDILQHRLHERLLESVGAPHLQQFLPYRLQRDARKGESHHLSERRVVRHTLHGGRYFGIGVRTQAVDSRFFLYSIHNLSHFPDTNISKYI